MNFGTEHDSHLRWKARVDNVGVVLADGAARSGDRNYKSEEFMTRYDIV